MTGFEAYRLSLAIKAHFTQKGYDYFKYKGGAKAKEETYRRRNDKFFFEKLAKYPDDELTMMFVVNQLKDTPEWIGQLGLLKEAYDDWKKKIEALSYTFEQDINTLKEKNEKFNPMVKYESGNHPPLLKLYLTEEVNLETMVILDEIFGSKITIHWNEAHDPIIDEVVLKIQKYKPFLFRFALVDLDKLKKIFLKHYSKHTEH